MKKTINGLASVIDKSSFISAVVTMVLIFLLTFISLFSILSLKDYNKRVENKNQIIVYLNDLGEEEKQEFSKKLLKLEGISSVRYESKELALQGVMHDLGINLSQNENPLEDAFYVFLKNDVDLEKLKDNLVNMKEISAFDFRTKAIQDSINITNNIQTISGNATIIMMIFAIIMIYNIIKFSILPKKKEIENGLNIGQSVNNIKKIFFIENIMSLTTAFIISLILYSIVKSKLIDNIRLVFPTYKSGISAVTESFWLVFIFILTILISAFINYIVMHKYFVKHIGDKNE